METILVNTKDCPHCSNPLHLTLLGPRKIRVWVHRDKELDTCTALKLDRYLMKELSNVLENIRKVNHVCVQRNRKGEPVIFGEPEIKSTT